MIEETPPKSPNNGGVSMVKLVLPKLTKVFCLVLILKMTNRIFTPNNCDCCSKKLFHHHVTIDIGPFGDSEDFLANSRMPKSDVSKDEVDMKILGRTEKGQELSEGSLSLCTSTLKQQFSEGSLSLCTSALKQHLQRRSKKPKNPRRTSEKKLTLGRLNI